jgi:glycosyltransferase involved in cell wall biosynthesis
MTISIIIPAYNEEKLLGKTLEAVMAARSAFIAGGWESEVIVCDNNSTDGTGRLARAAGARVVLEPVNQIARARNTGAAAARGEWLLFIDADSRPSAALFADVIAAIENGRVLAGGSTIHMDSPAWLARVSTVVWNGISRTTLSLAGSFIFCESAAFRRIGGFNLKLFASEELDLCKRLKLLASETGRRIVILSKHPLATSARKLELYSIWEYLRFLGRTVFGWGRTLESAEECHIWYDGRR